LWGAPYVSDDSGPVRQQQDAGQWQSRNQTTQLNWEAKLQHNRQQAQQYAAYDGADFKQQQLELALCSCTNIVAAGMVRHSCCSFCLTNPEKLQLSTDLAAQLLKAAQQPEQQQQQQQQHGHSEQQQQQEGHAGQQQQQEGHAGQQQQQQQEADTHLGQDRQQQQQQQPRMLQIASMRLVACYVMGASFWMPLPIVHCSCCGWELSAATVGFFGSSPVQPNAWFSVQLLDMYSVLFKTSGVSATAYAEALSRTAVTADWCPALPRDILALTPIDDRYVQSWLSYGFIPAMSVMCVTSDLLFCVCRNLSAAWEQWRVVCICFTTDLAAAEIFAPNNTKQGAALPNHRKALLACTRTCMWAASPSMAVAHRWLIIML
jgi:hypothetical protein